MAHCTFNHPPTSSPPPTHTLLSSLVYVSFAYFSYWIFHPPFHLHRASPHFNGRSLMAAIPKRGERELFFGISGVMSSIRLARIVYVVVVLLSVFLSRITFNNTSHHHPPPLSSSIIWPFNVSPLSHVYK